MAVSCSHGDMVHPEIREQILDFRNRFNPQIRFELGDLIDTACFRKGASGTPDEARNPRDDEAAAISWLRDYEPNRITWGNHDWRLFEARESPKAIVAALAGEMWKRLTDEAAQLKAKTAPYDIEDGWIYEGGTAWGHGYMFSMNAVRDHAEMLGCPVVMGHLHTPQQVEGRTVNRSPSFCAGAMADDRKLTYGRRRRNSLTHSHGVVFGEISREESRLWLARAPKNGSPIEFPPGL